MITTTTSRNFNPRGLRRPRPPSQPGQSPAAFISIHEVFADLDRPAAGACLPRPSFQSTRSSQTSTLVLVALCGTVLFQSTRSSQTSTSGSFSPSGSLIFQSTRSSQTSTLHAGGVLVVLFISIHEVFADLDCSDGRSLPRQQGISIHEVFADLDGREPVLSGHIKRISIHEVFADLDPDICLDRRQQVISIHEVFADLDTTPPSLARLPSEFQSTRSSQTSTGQSHEGVAPVLISIHEVFADLDSLAALVGK